MSNLDDDFSHLAANQHQLKRWLVVMAAGVLLMLIWSISAKLDVVSIAQGEVIPADKVQTIAHLEGGVIRRVMVKEGQTVEAGEALVELESTAFGASVAELALRLDSFKADLWRINAELVGAETLVEPPEVSNELIEQAKQLFSARKQKLQNDVEVQKEEIVRREQSLNRIKARLENQQQRLKLLEEQITISDELVQQEIASRYEHINLLKEASALRSQIAEDKEAAVGADAEIKQAKSAADNILVDYQRELTETRDEAVRNLNELSERYKKYQDDLSRTVLVAPVSGVVKRIYLFTKGGVVGPGETVLDLVPDQSKVVVEARLQPQDIGYVGLGATALIRLNSVDAIRFEALKGEVVNISPDTLVDNDGNAYYVVKIETERDYFKKDAQRYPLVPGVMVTAGIVLGDRSILRYVLSPFLRSTYFALSER